MEMEEEKYLERIKESCTSSPGGRGEDENEEDLVFPGFRFHPTDQELVGFYLTRKVEKKAFSIEIIKEIDIYKHDPWDLPKSSHLQQGSGEEEWYFFCLRGRKYRNSIRPNRVTGSGFWKATGIDKPIYPSSSSSSSSAGECIGLKKSLVYYRGSAGKGTKTDWMMHEFRLPSSPAEATTNSPSPNTFQEAEIWTICRIFKRNMSYNKRCQQQQQKDQHGKGASSMISNKRSHQNYQHQQLESYYHYHHYTCSSSTATNSFESDAGRAHVTTHHQPFILSGFHAGASSAAVTSSGMGAPPPSGWTDHLVSLRGSSSWDELGRIMEVSTDSTYL